MNNESRTFIALNILYKVTFYRISHQGLAQMQNSVEIIERSKRILI